MRATIYNRVSSDDSGEAASVSQQDDLNREECARREWDVVAVFTDNDVGASRYSQGKRTDYEKLVEWVRGGNTDVLVLFEDSRMTRRMDEYVVLRDASRDNKVLWCISGSIKDLNNKGDRISTGLSALMSEEASAETSARVLRSVNARIRLGRPHGRLVYGYKRVYDPHSGAFTEQVEDPETGPIVKEIARRFLAGETMYAIYRDLNERGIPPLYGQRSRPDYGWTHNMIRKILVNPHYAAIRVRNGVEEETRGNWTPLIPETEWRQINTVLSDNQRKYRRDTTAKHLLSGIALCGTCGYPMAARVNRGVMSYLCPKGWCTARRLDKTDEAVKERIIAFLSLPDAREKLAGDDEEAAAAQAEAVVLRERLEELETELENASPAMMRSLLKVIDRVSVNLTAAEERARPKHVPAQAVKLAAAANKVRYWDDELSLAQRREVVRVLYTIRVHPAGPGRRTFDPRLIEVIANTSADQDEVLVST